jgi:hypothetical protein
MDQLNWLGGRLRRGFEQRFDLVRDQLHGERPCLRHGHAKG